MGHILDMDLDIDIISAELYSESFNEFCENLKKLGVATDTDLYLEAVIDNNKNIKNTAKNVAKNTISTTKDVGKVYGIATTGAGNAIKSVWDLAMHCITLCVKLLAFILNKITKIPRFINKVLYKVQEIPADITNKIRGNISLYITADDVRNIYTTGIFYILRDFLDDAKVLSQGEIWGTLFNKRQSDSPIRPKENDIKLCKKLAKSYAKLMNIDFTKTVIQMNDQNNVKIYFGDEKCIIFNDLNDNNKHHEDTYYEALRHLMNDLSGKSDDLKAIQEALSKKYEISRENSSFGNLSNENQQIVYESIQMVSKVVTVIGNIIKYVMIDMKTINDTVDQIMAKSKK